MDIEWSKYNSSQYHLLPSWLGKSLDDNNGVYIRTLTTRAIALYCLAYCETFYWESSRYRHTYTVVAYGGRNVWWMHWGVVHSATYYTHARQLWLQSDILYIRCWFMLTILIDLTSLGIYFLLLTSTIVMRFLRVSYY